ncbi:MAG: FG-GAP repeat protein [Acidobacteriota bacterium]
MPLIASVLCGLALVVAGSLPRRPSMPTSLPLAAVSDRATSHPASTNPAFVPTFRLGNAAQPFGWSTAVGDFNTDGTPDLVIADHTSRRDGLYAYQIQFSVSGLDPRNFAFESPQDAISVRISDVDHDDDLDVVVNSAASREVVGIWLNDGHGRFRSADVRRFASETRVLRSVNAATDRASDPSAGTVRDRRWTDGLVVLGHSAPVAAPSPLLVVACGLRLSLPSSFAAPRGPPLQLA